MLGRAVLDLAQGTRTEEALLHFKFQCICAHQMICSIISAVLDIFNFYYPGCSSSCCSVEWTTLAEKERENLKRQTAK